MRRTFAGASFPVSAHTESEVDRLTGILDKLTAQMDPLHPWDMPGAAELDRISFSSWLEQQSDDPEARDNIALYIGPAMLTKPAHSFSALSAVLMAASAGSFTHLVDADFILDRRVKGGLQQVPLRLAEELGDAVITGTPVTSIEYTTEGVLVNGTWQARRVIVAVPPTLVSRIQFTPNLPPVHMQARQHTSFGIVIKLHITYPTPFWREDGLSGTAFSRIKWFTRPTTTPTTTTPGAHSSVSPRTRTPTPFSPCRRTSERPASWTSRHLLRREGSAPVGLLREPLDGRGVDRGRYAVSFDIGGLTRYGATLRQPVGPISFGTSDVAGLGFQHVDGAIRIGRMLAEALL